ncbi:hypothetical protein HQ571_03855 [Candidatus Kuenenbacteria bacterium]|nr:hypothetical protein [Candidatus Kuenenbacteria bacterium]
MFLDKILQRKELARGLWHSISITSAAMFFYFADNTALALLLNFALIFIAFDFGRSRNVQWVKKVIKVLTGDFFFAVLREKEKTHLSTSSHFIIAGIVIIIMHLFFGLPKAVMICSALFVAIGDPMARLIGKEWKGTGLNGFVRPELLKKRLYGKKTLIGSFAFLVFGYSSALLFCHIGNFSLGANNLLLGAFVATVVELYATDWDNFFVPLSAVLIMWIFV